MFSKMKSIPAQSYHANSPSNLASSTDNFNMVISLAKLSNKIMLQSSGIKFNIKRGRELRSVWPHHWAKDMYNTKETLCIPWIRIAFNHFLSIFAPPVPIIDNINLTNCMDNKT